MSHATGMLQPLLHYIVGGTNVLMKEYSPALFLEITQKEKVTTTLITSPLLASIIGCPDIGKYDVSSLRLALTGGALIPDGPAGKFNEIFGDIILPGYGMTEASSFIIIAPLRDGTLSEVRRPGSSGKELVNVEVRVVNEEGEDVAPGDIGELLIAGDNIMEGYWEMPEETAKALEGGYLHTGDLASRDEEGYYYITGRKKDIIFTAGKEVLSPEIENVISLHPAVSEMAVIGVPDEKLGELVKVFIVLKKGKRATEQEIIKWCARRLEDYKVPKMVSFIASLPKTASGKVQTTALEKQK
jgi:long-chain acyl-CoA synthetase